MLSVKQKIGQDLELVKTSEIQSLSVLYYPLPQRLTFDQTTPHPLLNTNQQSPQFVTGVWKSRKPETGIGSGMGTASGTRNGNGTGTVM